MRSRKLRLAVKLVLPSNNVTIPKKPAGKWEKISGESYAKVQPDPDTGVPQGLGFERIPSFCMLMQENKDRQIFANMGGPPKRR